MPFESSVFQREIQEIVSNGVKNVYGRWEATLHANGRDVVVYYIDAVEFHRDYTGKLFDDVIVDIVVSPGTFEREVIPYKENLELTLVRKALSETGNLEADGVEVNSYRYRAVLFDGQSGIVEGGNVAMQSTTAMDSADLKTVKLQLIDPVAEQLRLKTLGTNFRNTTAINAVSVAFTMLSKNIKNADDTYAVKGVDIAPNHVETVREYIAVPHLTKLVQLPEYVHEFAGGLYNGGLGYYLQDGIWYFFPPFDITRYPKTRKTLTILNVPAERYPSPERSYRETDSQLIILATGTVKQIDQTEAMQMNMGNGVRFADANRLFTQFAKVGGNKAVVARGLNTSEFISSERESGINNAQRSLNDITANYAVERSRLAARQGSYINLLWESSVKEKLYPGMPVKLMYLENERAQELYGVLHNATTFELPVNQSIKERKFNAKTSLIVFVDKKITFPDPDYV